MTSQHKIWLRSVCLFPRINQVIIPVPNEYTPPTRLPEDNKQKVSHKIVSMWSNVPTRFHNKKYWINKPLDRSTFGSRYAQPRSDKSGNRKMIAMTLGSVTVFPAKAIQNCQKLKQLHKTPLKKLLYWITPIFSVR